ncbi:type-F conjugative transfer system protein TraW [Rickettsiales endosymbiont of Trichoplax sp. H2]|uniref:type-F conjugative transfer system protein TraW n=1 Tax=Rickettsiales endosymbiont of Trichoplax sp. H2 TaxID=2021221 RepID=UPI0012B189ED|nr:type-F conjugative transfer system protein TraW [Rickettsiales endosymbiont of Trichoplax sp. H2]MSO14467.1 Protein TraW [Rickettsiales endosymbiont of Trichoplax sp. H2]
MEKDKNKKEKRCDFDRCINYIYLIYIIIAAIFIAIVFIYLTSTADAKDLGVVGRVWEISESDPIEDIKNKLKVMESNGELDKHNEKIKEQIKKRIENPKNLGIGRAEEEKEYYYNPSISKPHDLRDHKGQVYYKAGTVINPLDQMNMDSELIFFDGEDSEQLEFAIDLYKNSFKKPILILTGGSPIKLEKKYKLDFYYDQDGVIIKKLEIKAVPALVVQEGRKLKVKEVMLQ